MPITVENMTTLISQWIETYVYGSNALAILGFVCIIAVAVFCLVFVWRRARRIMDQFYGYYSSRKAGKLQISGYKILLGQIGPRARWRKRLKSVLVSELGEFLFSSTFLVLDTPRLINGNTDIAKTRLQRANADIIVWADAVEGDKTTLALKCIRRVGGGARLNTSLSVVNIPATGDFWRQENAWCLISYIVANGVQPILSTPSAFRREKVLGLVKKLQAIIDSGVLDLVDPSLKAKIEDEFSAGALHVSDQTDETDFLSLVIKLRRQNLKESDVHDIDRTIKIKMQLGNALIRKSERKYDNKDISDAVVYLSEAIESMKRNPRIIEAQNASDQLNRARGLVESRQRFALSFG